MQLAPGTRLGSYEVVGPLGAGGMGEVYLARDTRLDREVALKVLPRRMSQDEESIARFRREALTLASMNHPNLATVFGFEEVPDGPVVLVLEHVEGVTLAGRLAAGALAMREALAICAQVAQGLEAAHERGVMHRDVKPGNIMIGPRGLVKVLDFGLASRVKAFNSTGPESRGDPGAAAGAAPPLAGDEFAADAPTLLAPLSPALDEAPTIAGPPRTSPGAPGTSATGSMTGMIIGTPGYMSPEQVRAEAMDERTDLFALGCVLYECLTGRRAFPGRTAIEIMNATLRGEADFAALPAALPGRVTALLERCLSKDPGGRPRDMRTVRLELEEALGIRHASALREGETPAIRHNLPVPATSFVGRESTLAECAQALEGSRLLTLAGMGGSGKTRLALRLAEAQLESFPDGVWFVDVAPLLEPGRLLEVLAATLEVPEEPGRTLLQGVVRTLQDSRALVLFDNAETHAEACTYLAARLLASCRHLKLLLTSREPLGLDGETVYTVPTLAVPGPDVRTAAAATAFESMRLFADRARAAAPAFELDDTNAAAVAEICRRLDGIPLALELAAARVRLLGVEQVRERLGDRFKLLTRGGAAGTGRQQTVLAVIEWSWEHLLPPEQDLMARLAVFAGGWTLERASAVCSESADDFAVLDLLTRLAERSLVVVERGPSARVRYRFLESVWRFALDRLEARPEQADVRSRHLAIYAEFAERAEKRMSGSALAETLAELVPEEENLLAALAWCPHAERGAELGLRLATGAHRFWSVRGQYVRGQRAMEDALALDAARAPSPLLARALTRAAGFALNLGRYDAGRTHLEASLAMCRSTGDRMGEARTVAGLAVVALTQSRLDDALALGEAALALYAEQGQRRGVAMALHNIATVEVALGRHSRAREKFEEAVAILREVGDEATETLALCALACALVALGERGLARERLRECLRLLDRLEIPREALYALESLAYWLSAEARMAEAARCFGAAEAQRARLGTALLPNEAREIAAVLARIEEVLGVEATESARAAGRLLPLADALTEAGELLG